MEPAIVGPTIAASLAIHPDKSKPESAWVWSQYSITSLQSVWRPYGKNKDIIDRIITCTRCNTWTIKDSTRKGSTSNMIRHLGREHQAYPPSQGLSNLGSSSSQSTPSIASLFLQQSNKDTIKQFEKNLVRWIVAEDIAFAAIESPFFQEMINDIPGVSMPFKSRNTLTARISTEFELDRQKLIQDLAISSQTIALSLDGWTSNNDISILAVIGH
jgi:BED zinc finger